RSRHFVLYASDQPVAAGTLISERAYACLYNIATIPSARQKGFGREIVQHLLAVAADAGCEIIFLQVDSASMAKRLYEKLGFRMEFVRHGFRQTKWRAKEQERPLLAGMFGGRSET